MADRSKRIDIDARPPTVPVWSHSMRLTKEQLAAAERTLDYHLRKLQQRMATEQRGSDPAARGDH